MLDVGKSRKKSGQIKENLKFIQGKRWPGVGNIGYPCSYHDESHTSLPEAKAYQEGLRFLEGLVVNGFVIGVTVDIAIICIVM